MKKEGEKKMNEDKVLNELMSIDDVDQTPAMVIVKGQLSKQQSFNMLKGQDKKLSVGEELTMVGVIFHPCQVKTQSGEYEEHIRTVILDNEGTTWGSVSNGIFREMKQIISFFGEPTEDMPIKIRITQKHFTGKDGMARQTYAIKVL